MRRANLFYRVAIGLLITLVLVLGIILASWAFDVEFVTAADKLLNELATVLGILAGRGRPAGQASQQR